MLGVEPGPSNLKSATLAVKPLGLHQTQIVAFNNTISNFTMKRKHNAMTYFLSQIPFTSQYISVGPIAQW